MTHACNRKVVCLSATPTMDSEGAPATLSPGEPPSAPAHAVRRGGGLYFGASLFSQAAALIRYVILARLLGPEQLGIAATLVVTASFFDLISDTGSDRFLIQDRDGGTPQVQKLVQLVFAGRGAITASLLVLLAIPIAHFYNVPSLAKGFAILALSPLILGFQNLDYRRIQREHDFRPEAVCMLFADLTSLLVTAIAAWFTHSFQAVLWGMITRAVVMVAATHLRAERPYRIGWDPLHAPQLYRFAAPLMLNGLMLFALSQGDRVIVGKYLGTAALGAYSAAILLVFYPTVLLARYIHAIYIPVIAAHRDSPSDVVRISDELGGQTIVFSLAMAVGYAIAAPIVVPVLFGARYSQGTLLLGLIGILQTARFLLNWPSTAALAMGRSKTVLLSNVFHLLAFATALVGLWILRGLAGVVAGFISGEVLCAGIALALLNRDMARSWWHGFNRLSEFVAVSLMIVGWTTAFQWRVWLAMPVLSAGTLGVAYWLYRSEAQATGQLLAVAARLAKSTLTRMDRLRHLAWTRAERAMGRAT